LYDVLRERLPGGLSVLVLSREGLNALDVSLTLSAGPRFESAETSGLSHLVEHMVFRGTEQYPDSHAFHWALESLGGTLQGSTGRDLSLFGLTVSPRDLAESMELLAEATLRPTFADLDVERSLVLEELLQDRDEDDRELNLENLSRKLLWPHDPLGLPIVGSRSNVEGFDVDDIRRWHQHLMCQGNGLLTVSGPVDPGDALDRVRRTFSSMTTGDALPRRRLRNRRPGPHVDHVDHDASQVEVMLSFPAPGLLDPDPQGVALLQIILADGVTSRLQWRVCEQKGLAYTIEAHYDALGDAGALDIEAAVAPASLVPLMREVILTLRELKEKGPSADELKRARRRYRLALEFALDSPTALASYHIPALYGVDRTIEARLRELEAWTPARLRVLIRRLITRAGATLVSVGPAEALDLRRIRRLLRQI
jgi:predicted Zn-dependent peptidase